MITSGLVEEAIRRAGTDTITPVPSLQEAYLRQCCDRVWTTLRDQLAEVGETRAAALIQTWCEPEWMRKS